MKCCADNKFLEYSGARTCNRILKLCQVWIPKVRTRTALGKDKHECYRDAKKLPKKCCGNTKCYVIMFIKIPVIKQFSQFFKLISVYSTRRNGLDILQGVPKVRSSDFMHYNF